LIINLSLFRVWRAFPHHREPNCRPDQTYRRIKRINQRGCCIALPNHENFGHLSTFPVFGEARLIKPAAGPGKNKKPVSVGVVKTPVSAVTANLPVNRSAFVKAPV
jgi:hypothetical protein